MDLNLTAEEKQFRNELRSWLEANVPKDWSEWREKPIEESFTYLRAWQRKLYEGGWAAVSWPKEYGGRGASLMQQSIFWEEMARVEAPPMANSLGLGLIGPTIIAYGTDAQKKRYIPKILSAEEIWCQGFSEPNAGSDLASLGDRRGLAWRCGHPARRSARARGALAPQAAGRSAERRPRGHGRLTAGSKSYAALRGCPGWPAQAPGLHWSTGLRRSRRP